MVYSVFFYNLLVSSRLFGVNKVVGEVGICIFFFFLGRGNDVVNVFILIFVKFEERDYV